MGKGKRKSAPEVDNAVNKKEQKSTNEEKEQKLLGYMLSQLMNAKDAVSFRQCSKDLGFMERTKTWQAAWKSLKDNGNIEPCQAGAAQYTSDFQLTQQGKDLGATDEYKEFLAEQNFQPKTTEEQQERLKKRLDKKFYGDKLFDLLLEHGSLSRAEMCGILGFVSGSHKFSYGFKDMKDKGFMEIDPGDKKKLRLTDKVFLNQEDRPEQSDPDVIEKLIEATTQAKLAKKDGAEKTGKKAKGATTKTKDKAKASPKEGNEKSDDKDDDERSTTKETPAPAEEGTKDKLASTKEEQKNPPDDAPSDKVPDAAQSEKHPNGVPSEISLH